MQVVLNEDTYNHDAFLEFGALCEVIRNCRYLIIDIVNVKLFILPFFSRLEIQEFLLFQQLCQLTTDIMLNCRTELKLYLS